MPAIKILYFPLPGRAEPARLALAVGGIAFEDERISGADWASKVKPTVAPRQMPLMYVDGEAIGQSGAQMKYAAKLASVDGKPLYPTDALEALKVDEFCDIVAETFGPLGSTFSITDEAEKAAARTALVAEDGGITKWLVFVNDLLGKSSSGFAVGDSFTLADICTFTWLQPLKAGWLDGMPKDCLDKYANICKHAEKIANLPQVKNYYKDATGVHAVFKA
eukprot:TRINITY_DN342_c0_g1_i10.p1 TRINITY_DN342_c0_g1~~TRINITY_DN342_c0_g1_i10.p1  ORF type:complete len:242 (+),score=87.91 TRINITY_DN342_c0_g1_i10:64-726(+)